jgi:alcohol dehydrogenase class IV
MPDPTVRWFDTTSVPLVLHGIGATKQIARLLEERGHSRVLLVSTRSLIEKTDAVERLGRLFGDRVVAVAPAVSSHTPPADVEAVVEAGREAEADAIVALGGSSVSDGAKIAALRLGGAEPVVTVEEGIARHAESGHGARPIPLIAIPTTLSAGEFRGSAGMVDEARGIKLMCEDPRLRPCAVVLDPEVTLHTPPALWASSGVKAMDHAAETIWGARSHPMGDALSADALRRLARSLPRTVADPTDLDARLDCQIGAWLSIHTMTNTLIHLSHALAHSMGGYWRLEHGVTSCIALPVIMDYLSDLEPTKVAQVARALDPTLGRHRSDAEVAKDGAAWLANFVDALEVPTRLRDVIADFSGLDEVTQKATGELAYFGYLPPGGATTVKDLLSRMW